MRGMKNVDDLVERQSVPLSGAGGSINFIPHRTGAPPITFAPGKGYNAADGDIVFRDADEKEWLRLKSNGIVCVQGRERPCVDAEIYSMFRQWLESATIPRVRLMDEGCIVAAEDAKPDCVVTP